MRTTLRTWLLAVLAMLAVSAVASASASALVSDEYLWKVAGKTLAAGESQNVKTKGGPYQLDIHFSTTPIEIECKKQGEQGKGNIKGGNPGTDEATLTFTECKVLGAGTCTVTVEPMKVKAEIVEIVRELNEDTGEGKSVDAKVGELFTPTATKFTTITIGVCALRGKYELTGNVVAHVSPEEVEAAKPNLIFRDSNPVTEVEKAPNDEKLAIGLKLAGNRVELMGESEAELEGGAIFGAFGAGA